jgi:hypothetical protein
MVSIMGSFKVERGAKNSFSMAPVVPLFELLLFMLLLLLPCDPAFMTGLAHWGVGVVFIIVRYVVIQEV